MARTVAAVGWAGARPAILARLGLAVLLAVPTAVVASAAPARADPNPIVVENRQPGTSDWQIKNKSDDEREQVKGYASATSVNKGESISFFVTVNPVQSYSIDVYRVGYYRGLGGRLMQHVDPTPGVRQPPCLPDAMTGMVSCNWSPSYTLAVGSTWTSGIYLAKLTNASKFQNYIIFVVRDDNRPSALLYQQPVTTYQAYNNYPNDVSPGSTTPTTGKSLYDFNSSPSTTGLGTTRAVKVSFDRPYADGMWRGDGSGQFTEWESYYVRWLEQNGFDVSYSTNIDVDRNGIQLLDHRGFISVGHDEYWSAAMFDAAENARDHGVGLGFFGANAVYWQVRFEPSTEGRADRVIVCYKDSRLDPVKGATTSVRWRDPPVSRPEQLLLGAMSSSMLPSSASPAMYVATGTTSFMYTGTGTADGQPIARIVGYETDRYQSQYPSPPTTAGSYTALSHSAFINSDGAPDYQESRIYQAPSGAWVFAAGTIQWSWGLFNDDVQHRADSRIQGMTANFLSRISAGAQAAPARSPAASTVSFSFGSLFKRPWLWAAAAAVITALAFLWVRSRRTS